MVGLRCRPSPYPALTRPPGVHTPGYMMSPLSGLVDGWFALSPIFVTGVDTTTRRSHAGLYDVAPFGAREWLVCVVARLGTGVDTTTRRSHAGRYDVAPFGARGWLVCIVAGLGTRR